MIHKNLLRMQACDVYPENVQVVILTHLFYLFIYFFLGTKITLLTLLFSIYSFAFVVGNKIQRFYTILFHVANPM